ncbi:hypothetical protein Tco_0576820 [Tanacetum coccineum]
MICPLSPSPSYYHNALESNSFQFAPILGSRIPGIPPPFILISLDSTLSSKMPCLVAIVAFNFGFIKANWFFCIKLYAFYSLFVKKFFTLIENHGLLATSNVYFFKVSYSSSCLSPHDPCFRVSFLTVSATMENRGGITDGEFVLDKNKGTASLNASTAFASYGSTGGMSLPTEVTAPLSNNNEVNKSTIVKSSLTDTNINTTYGAGISGTSNAQIEGNNDVIVFNIVLNVLNIVENFDVPFKIFADNEDLMNGIEMGKHEVIWPGMTEERCKDVMDSMYITWKRLTEENLSVASSVGNTTMDTSNDDTLHVDPIVQSVIIQDKPRSYVGVVDGSKPKPSKSNENFRSLSFENLCEGAMFSMPRKVVETVSTRFANTLYGYFFGKCIALPVVEYYVRKTREIMD